MYNDKEIIENLKSKITRLERRINELETKFYRENENKQEIIRGNIEIEPYEKRAKQAYDNWVLNPER
jgi:hypothetical protein